MFTDLRAWCWDEEGLLFGSNSRCALSHFSCVLTPPFQVCQVLKIKQWCHLCGSYWERSLQRDIRLLWLNWLLCVMAPVWLSDHQRSGDCFLQEAGEEVSKPLSAQWFILRELGSVFHKIDTPKEIWGSFNSSAGLKLLQVTWAEETGSPSFRHRLVVPLQWHTNSFPEM